jgi:nuclear pore complex protein Nup133
MADVGEAHHEDYMRAFFRLRVADVGKIILKTMDIVRKSAYSMNKTTVDVLSQANYIVCVSTGVFLRRFFLG